MSQMKGTIRREKETEVSALNCLRNQDAGQLLQPGIGRQTETQTISSPSLLPQQQLSLEEFRHRSQHLSYEVPSAQHYSEQRQHESDVKEVDFKTGKQAATKLKRPLESDGEKAMVDRTVQAAGSAFDSWVPTLAEGGPTEKHEENGTLLNEATLAQLPREPGSVYAHNMSSFFLPVQPDEYLEDMSSHRELEYGGSSYEKFKELFAGNDDIDWSSSDSGKSSASADLETLQNLAEKAQALLEECRNDRSRRSGPHDSS